MNSHANPEHMAALAGLVQRFDPEKLAQEGIEAGHEWADLDAAASVLEESRKTVLAQRVLSYVRPSSPDVKPIPMNQAEMRGLADPEYQMHVELMVEARKRANKARVRYDLTKAKLDMYRTHMSTLRQELRTLG